MTSIFTKATLALAALAVVSTANITSANAEGYYVHEYARTVNFEPWDKLNIRNWPASYSQQNSAVRLDRKVYVERCIMKDGADWCKITKNWKTGWVHGGFIAKDGHSFAAPHPLAYDWH